MYLVTKSLLGIFSGSAVSFFIYKTIRIYLMRLEYAHIPGPPTKGIIGFYMGNLGKIVETMNNGKILSDLTNEWTKLYGSVYKFQVADQTIVFTVHAEGVKHVLITNNFPKVPGIYQNVGFPYNERFLGNGLITETNKSRWKSRRARFNPGFHRQCLMNFMEEINSKGNILLDRFKTIADGVTVVKMFEEVNHAALDIIASVAFGMNVDSINNPENSLHTYVYESLKGFYRITFDPLIHYKPWEWNYIYQYKKVLRKLREIGRNEILNRIELLKQGDYMADDILTNLLKTHDEIDVEEMVDDFSTFFIAGQETTANTLAFVFIEIARNPDVLKKLRKELDEVLGSKNDVNYEDLNKLNYTGCVYKETLRLWPPIPEIARQIDDHFSVKGYTVPKNTWLQVSSYVSARQEHYFLDSEKFNPDRFIFNESSGQYTYPIQNYTYFPFSLGPRSCIGQNFALMVGKIFIAKVVKNFDIVLDLNQNMGVTQEATLRPTDSARCYLTPRKV